MIPAVKAKLLEGKRGLIIGIANENSIAWGCAKAFRALGADLAVTYLNEKAKKYVEPLARELEAPIVMPLDVGTPGQMEAVRQRTKASARPIISSTGKEPGSACAMAKSSELTTMAAPTDMLWRRPGKTKPRKNISSQKGAMNTAAKSVA